MTTIVLPFERRSYVALAAELTRVDAAFAGRALAAYGGIYSSLVWMAVVERTTPRISDYVGAVICLLGAGVILYRARWATT